MAGPETGAALHHPGNHGYNRGSRFGDVLVFGGLVAAIAAVALTGMKGNSPQCEGTQRVTLGEGDVPQLVAQEHIDVTSGYVDIQQMVDFGRKAPPAAIISPFYDEDAVIRVIEGPAHQNPNISGWQPGDVVVMPQTCKTSVF